MLKENDEIVTNPNDILKCQEQFYGALYTKDENVKFKLLAQNIPKLTEEEKYSMEGPIMLDELTHALKNMGRNKSAGVDGLSTEFFIVFWNRLGNLLLNACTYSFEKNKIFPSALVSLIVTIPKKNWDGHILKNIRPISLLCTDSKIIEKAIAERIKPKLQNIIHLNQKGFLSGRKISVNIRCILDIMDHLDRHDESGIIMSIDYEKCFDRISRESLLKAMEVFNFGENIRKWTKMLFEGSHAYILNNGHFSKKIPLEKGCKQGAPASAYFFLICA